MSADCPFCSLIKSDDKSRTVKESSHAVAILTNQKERQLTIDAKVNHQGKILRELIGAIVLATQDVERHLKFVNPYMGTDEREVDRKLASLDKQKKQTFGQLVGAFLKNSRVDSDRGEDHFKNLINTRNEVVHHFSEVYGPQIKSGNIDNVISTLQTQLSNIKYFRDALAQFAIQLLELLCESNLDRSPEADQLRELLEELRSR